MNLDFALSETENPKTIFPFSKYVTCVSTVYRTDEKTFVENSSAVSTIFRLDVRNF